jgi:hypothetical protein
VLCNEQLQGLGEASYLIKITGFSQTLCTQMILIQQMINEETFTFTLPLLVFIKKSTFVAPITNFLIAIRVKAKTKFRTAQTMYILQF